MAANKQRHSDAFGAGAHGRYEARRSACDGMPMTQI